MASRYDLTRDELARIVTELGQPSYRADQIWEGLHVHGLGPSDLTTLPTALRQSLEARPEFAPALTTVLESSSEGGETVKWLWSLADGRQIETVLMHYPGRSTVCVSSQAGCAMGCGFCATGQAGFDRHLTSGEIVEQVVRAKVSSAKTGRRLSNVVFMGMGEPMANYDAVVASVHRIHADLGLSARHLTISTVGIIPGIRRLADEPLPVNLAVSLHAANDDLRDALVPVNRRYPLADLAAACSAYLDAKGRRLSFEWALIDGVNDRPSDARELAGYALGLGAHINLIPLNPTPGYPVQGTPPGRVRDFCDRLTALGANATVRQNRGTSIDAACGQLRASARDGETPVTLGRLGLGSTPLPD